MGIAIDATAAGPSRVGVGPFECMKQYDVVRVAAIRGDRFVREQPAFQRHPQVGDVGTILEVYRDAFEVECCERDTGVTIWLEAMFQDELQTL